MITQCCQCQRIREDDCWVVPKESSPADELVSHGYCPYCASLFKLEIKNTLSIPTEPSSLI